MMWAKFDDQFWSHPKILAAGNAAAGAFVRLVCYSSAHLSDGVIPADAVRMIATDDEVETLVRAGLVTRDVTRDVTKRSVTVTIHDYLSYQPARSKTLDERAAGAERQRQSRARRAGQDGNRPPNGGGSRHTVTNGVTDASPPPSVTPTRPVPSLPPTTSAATRPRDAAAAENLRYRSTTEIPGRLAESGMPVRTDKTNAEQWQRINELVAIHGEAKLVATAKRFYRPNSPAEHVQAFLPYWETLPVQSPRLALVRQWCDIHAVDYTAAHCPACAVDEIAAVR
jgi:hypothetical protein